MLLLGVAASRVGVVLAGCCLANLSYLDRYYRTMPDTRQLHVRLPVDAAAGASKRAGEMGISLNDWLVRAVVHALSHAEANGEPPPLRLPWSALL